MAPQLLRITILGLHYSPEPTGNAPYTSALARGLHDLGHEVHVVTGHPHYPDWRIWPGFGQWTRHECVAGVPVTRLRHYVPRRPSALKRLLSELSFGVRLLFARWGHPDVVLLISPALFSTMVAATRARWGLRRPAIGIWVQDLYSRGVAETNSGGRGAVALMAALESNLLNTATGVAVIHDRFKEVVTTRLHVSAERVTVIRNWSHSSVMPYENKADVRARHGWSMDEIIVLHAGNMGAKQALENVVSAAKIADERGLNLRFVLLGEGNQRSRLERLAKGVRRIQFISTLPEEEFQHTLASADILLVNEKPGVSDMAVPSKLTSYFGTGLPVLAATDPASVTASELRVSGGGVRADAGKPSELVEAVMKLAADPKRVREMGRAGMHFRCLYLTPETAINRYSEWLTGLALSRQ